MPSQHQHTHPHYRQPPRVPAAVVNGYIRAVAEHFEITPRALLSARSTGGGPPGYHPIYRQIAIYLLRQGTGIHMDILADRFQRSRTTIIRSIAMVERKLKSRAHAYLTAIQEVGAVLEKRGLAGSCDRCAIPCTPGPLCWQCGDETGLTKHASHVNGHGGKEKTNGVLTTGNTKTKFGSGREGGARRTNMPPGRKAAGPKASPRRGDL